VEGLVLGFLGYSFIPERYLPGQRFYAAPTLEAMTQEVEQLRERVDLVVVSVHWGEEATALPGRDVVEAGHAIVAAGAALVLGHHPHWFQPVEKVGRALIAYSLGDLLFDLFWDRRLVEGAILSVDLDEGGVVAHRLIPVRLDRDYRLRPQPDRVARRFLAELEENGRMLSGMRGDQAQTRSPRMEALRKVAYFLSRFHRGDRSQKARFVMGKIAEAFRRDLPGVHGRDS
jgi:poly-gamma-glutamate synthesis protein (capsule biosynthesis protein)